MLRNWEKVEGVRDPKVCLGFLGAVAKLREATVSFVMSVCLSVLGITRLPID